MSASGQSRDRARPYLVPVVAFACSLLLGSYGQGQTPAASFTFRAGQTVYIVAYRRIQQPATVDAMGAQVTRQDYFDNDLDAERKARNRLEEWQYFRVVDKPSAADFIFLVNLEDSSIEGLALPFEAYRQHYRDKFDLDALHDAAYGRYVAGPLNLPSISRLTDRLIKQFRAQVTKGSLR